MRNALSIATACAFNAGLISYQLRRPFRTISEKAFLHGERCAYRRVAKILLKRLEREDRKPILAGFRDGWTAARSQFATQEA